MQRAAVVIPGRMMGPYAPLTFYAASAARARQASVEYLDWQPPSSMAPDVGSAEGRQAWVVAEVTPAVDRAGTALLIGKSMATYATKLAAERDLPAVWLTPLLHEPLVVDSLRRSRAPFLLVGGTGDEVWDGPLARSLTPWVCEIPDADHGMQVPGPLAASAAILGEVVTAVERFMDEAVWPA